MNVSDFINGLSLGGSTNFEAEPGDTVRYRGRTARFLKRRAYETSTYAVDEALLLFENGHKKYVDTEDIEFVHGNI